MTSRTITTATGTAVDCDSVMRNVRQISPKQGYSESGSFGVNSQLTSQYKRASHTPFPFTSSDPKIGSVASVSFLCPIEFQRTSTIICSCTHSHSEWSEQRARRCDATRRAVDQMGLKYERFEASEQASKKAGSLSSQLWVGCPCCCPLLWFSFQPL